MKIDGFQVERVAAPLRLQVLQSIRTAIALGRFKPGERLTERDLCEMTGVSRSLIRETLRQLETEGLITVVPHRGPVVARVTVDKAREIYLVRCELEALACGLFAENASEDDQRALRAALKTLKSVMGKPDIAARLRAKDEFYECLLRGTRNETLAESLNMLNSRVTLLRATSLQAKGRSRDSITELTALVDALVARDADAARRLAREHVQNAGKTAIAILAAAEAAPQPAQAAG